MVSLDVTHGERGLGAPLPETLRTGARAPAPSRLSGLSTDLAIVALAVAMLPRLLTAAGAPALVKFLHFPMTLGAVLLVAPRIRSRASKQLLAGLYVLLCVILASAFLNGAGLVNAVLDFLLLSEPFLFLILVTAAASSSLARFRVAVVVIAVVHAALAYHQHFSLGLRGDDVEGVFIGQGAGAHVAGAVALTAAAYFAIALPHARVWVRVILALLSAPIVVLSDSKQVVVVFVASLAALSILQARPARALRYACLTAAACLAVFVASRTFFPAISVWTDPEKITEGFQQKASIFPLLLSYFHSPLNWLLGLGPGHTVGRLGELIPSYWAYLEPLGVTTTPITSEALWARESNWLSNPRAGSSMWSPIFFWSGALGDLGLLGIGMLAALWLLVWRSYCRDQLSRFLALNVFLFGATFSWLEEPGYMLWIAAIVALLWQQGLQRGPSLEHRSRAHSRGRMTTGRPCAGAPL